MAPSQSRPMKTDTGRVRHRHDTRFRDSDAKKDSKELKRKAEAVKILPPGLREEEDDEDWPPKYKKAPPPPKVRKVAARHPRTGRQQRDSTPPAPRPKVDLRVSPERAVDLYDEGWRNTTEGDPAVYERRMRMFYEQLKKDRDFERKKAIQGGLLSDPDKPTTLENAITIVGTCNEMCPVHERVERIVQQMVDKCEKVVHPATGEDVPFEDYMVKRFRRSAAGDDEQLPSDIRPPLVLQKTLNYLLEEIVAGPEMLSKVHKFVWDRTRAIRNDFSIQQVTKPDDVRVAIDCFERIARFHILALHQLSLPANVENSDFDAHQELEQLSKTLLSLTYYYDDNRGTVTSSNEAEFRAYTTVLEIGYPRPRLEQRANSWDKLVFEDQQVQMALSLYAMYGGIGLGEGPWFAGTSFEVARGNPRGFFPLLKSPKVPYLLACVAEISFYPIRGLILESIWNEYKDRVADSRTVKDWFGEDVRAILGFDDVDQATEFCLSHGLGMKKMKGNKKLLDLAKGHFQQEHRRSYPHVFSNKIVEDKRAFRTYLEIFNGLWAPQEGIEEALDDLEASVRETYEPLFVSDDSDTGDMDSSSAQDASAAIHQRSPLTAELTSAPITTRGFAIQDSLPPTSSFGKPTPLTLPSSQNQERSNTLQLSATFGEPEHVPKPNSSTVSSAAWKEQNPFGRADPLNSTKSPKTKKPFSAPPGKWQFPKDVIDNHTTKLASPANSTTKLSKVSSPQTTFENTNTQPVPSASESFFKKSSPNPFSQAPSGNMNAQSSPFSNSNPFQTTPRNPFSQGSWKDSNAQSASPAPMNLSTPVSVNPFSQVPRTNANAQPASTAPLNLLKPVSSNPFSQVSWTNANTQSTSTTPLNLSKPVSPNPFSQIAWTNANAQPASAAPLSLSTPILTNPFSQAASTDANAQSVSPTLLDLPKSVSPNPFFPHVSFEQSKAPESAPPQPLPLSNISQPSSGPAFAASTGKPSAWPEVSPFSGSFGNMVFNNPVGIASLPTLEQLFSNQQSTLQARPQNSFQISTAESDQSSTQLNRSTSQPGLSTFQLDQSTVQPVKTTLQPDAYTFQSGASTSQPVTSTSLPIPSASQLTTSTSQPITSFSQSVTSISQPNISNLPDTTISRLDQPASQTNKSTFQFVKASSQSDKPTLQHDQPTPQPDQSNPQPDQSILPPNLLISQPDKPTPQLDLPTSQLVKASPQSNESTSQPDVAISQPDEYTSQPDKSTSQSDKSTSQSDKSTSQPDKSTSIIQNATWTSSKFEETPSTIIRNTRKSYEQVKNERAQKKADEFRVMALSKKYIKKWRTIAWKKGLMRRAPERRRRFAQSLQQMAKDAARHQEDLVASLLSRKSGNRDQQIESEVSTDSILSHSTASKKRKSSDDEYESTPDRMSRNKRSRLDRVQNEHMTPSRRINSGHKRSRTVATPKLSETEELINTLIATRDDYSYLANGSESSYKIVQKIRTLLPPVKVDDTRSSYFMLKSLGIDPDTPIVPRTSRKRHSSDDIVSTPVKRLKESPQTKSASALPPIKQLKESPKTKSASASSLPSKSPRSRSPPASRRSLHQYGDWLETAQSVGLDKTENKPLAVQREMNDKMTDVVKMYKEQRAKWGSDRISNSGVTPSRTIEYYKEQRAKWGSPAPSVVTKPRQATPSKIEEVLRAAASARHAAQAMGTKRDTKSMVRAQIEQRQRDSYATMQPGAVGEGGLAQLSRFAAAAVGAPAGSSAEAAIEL